MNFHTTDGRSISFGNLCKSDTLFVIVVGLRSTKTKKSNQLDICVLKQLVIINMVINLSLYNGWQQLKNES